MDLPVLEALLDRRPDEAVLVESREALELWRRDRGSQVIAGTGLVDHLDRGAGQRRRDHPLDLCQVRHGGIVWVRPAFFPLRIPSTASSRQRSYNSLREHKLKGRALSKKASIPVIAAVMVGLLMVGCGGGDEPVAKAEFVQQANAICDTANAELVKSVQASATGDGVTPTLAALQSEIDVIADLTPPDGDEQQIDAMIGHMEKSIAAAEKTPVAKLLEANLELEKAEKIAKEYGLAKACLIER